MEIKLTLNGERIVQDIEPDLLLIDFVRKNGCYSVKRGCDTSNCGLCTVLLNDKPVLSCSILAMRANGAKVVTLEGMQEEAKPLATFIASQGAEQCGFCNPGFMMNTLALLKENPHPSDDEIKEYQAKREAFIAYKEELKKMKNEKSVTLDDHHVELVANIDLQKTSKVY